MNDAPFAAVLLAGGQSRRMGRDKALLGLPDGRSLWHRQLGVLRALQPAELFISGPPRDGFPHDVPCVEDDVPGRGPLGGVAVALGTMRSPRLVVLAIDLPGMTAEFLRILLNAEGHRGTVPWHAETDLFEPLAAVYPGASLETARERLRGDDWSMQGFVRAAGALLRPHRIAPDEETLFANWNELGV